jgi:hypothetical protein
LFLDEAGQMSLADVLAVSAGAKSLVLLGDPQQLEQPQQASHPQGAGASALEHLLDGAKTIANDRGLFLHQTRRLHPEICVLGHAAKVAATVSGDRYAAIPRPCARPWASRRRSASTSAMRSSTAIARAIPELSST